jgi:hypothetical protein
MDILPILIVTIIFGTIFGVFYLFITSRNRERLALIEKGADASLFKTSHSDGKNTGRMIVLNVAFTMLGIGLGILFATLLYNATQEDAMYPATIFSMAGIGLLASSFVNRKLNKG